jgi:hypothetical protein
MIGMKHVISIFPPLGHGYNKLLIWAAKKVGVDENNLVVLEDDSNSLLGMLFTIAIVLLIGLGSAFIFFVVMILWFITMDLKLLLIATDVTYWDHFNVFNSIFGMCLILTCYIYDKKQGEDGKCKPMVWVFLWTVVSALALVVRDSGLILFVVSGMLSWIWGALSWFLSCVVDGIWYLASGIRGGVTGLFSSVMSNIGKIFLLTGLVGAYAFIIYLLDKRKERKKIKDSDTDAPKSYCSDLFHMFVTSSAMMNNFHNYTSNAECSSHSNRDALFRTMITLPAITSFFDEMYEKFPKMSVAECDELFKDLYDYRKKELRNYDVKHFNTYGGLFQTKFGNMIRTKCLADAHCSEIVEKLMTKFASHMDESWKKHSTEFKAEHKLQKDRIEAKERKKELRRRKRFDKPSIMKRSCIWTTNTVTDVSSKIFDVSAQVITYSWELIKAKKADACPYITFKEGDEGQKMTEEGNQQLKKPKLTV